MPRGKAAKSLALIDACEDILQEIQPASVRAVCYRLFALGRIANMSKNETNKVGQQLTYARKVGRIAWEWIVDETRPEVLLAGWDNPAQYARSVTTGYRRNWWNDQPYDVKVWSEKATVGGTIRPVTDKYGVAFSAIHGFGSTTKLHDLADHARSLEKPMIVLYVGDFDPSGLYMSEVDLFARLRDERVTVYPWAEVADFRGEVVRPGDVVVRRLALTPEDVRQLERDGASFGVETKRTDPRYDWFRTHHGTRCAELDALNPQVLRQRIDDAVVEVIDREFWERAARMETVERDSIEAVLGKWAASLRRISVPA